MMLIVVLLGVYLTGQFCLAWWTDNRRRQESARLRAIVYSLSLVIYNGSWFYLSAVGSASRYGWNYITGYIGPIIAITVLFPVWRRVAQIVKQENIGSVADFLSSRYGKSRALGTLAACVTIAASLPYLAGQLRSLAMAWSAEAGSGRNSALVMLVFAGILAYFAIMFGAHKPALTDHNKGLVRVVAFDSFFKLLVLFIVAAVALTLILSRSQPQELAANLGSFSSPLRLDGGFFNSILLSAAVMFCAPRQFRIAFVELENVNDLTTARWLMPLYLIVATLLIVPITIAGTMLYHGAGSDLYVLKLAREEGGVLLGTLAFIGVVSCVAAVVTLESIALSAMVSNELVLPVVARLGWRSTKQTNVGRAILLIRHAAILAILALSWLYYYYSGRPVESLGNYNLIASAGLVQLMPALLGALYWRRGHVAGAIAGIAGGFALWIYYIAAPQFLANVGLVHNFGIRLAAASGTDQFVQKVLLTLMVNSALYICVSLLCRARAIDRIQAAAFVDARMEDAGSKHQSGLNGTFSNLKALLAQFLGVPEAEKIFAELERKTGRHFREGDQIDIALLRAAERILAGVIGSSLARSVLGWQLSTHGREPADVVRVLDDAAQAVQFNRTLLETALAHLSHGVYVVDRNARLKVWNTRYAEICEFPPGFLRVGMPIADAIRFTMTKDGMPDDEQENYVRQKLEHICQGTPQSFERQHQNGRILKTLGSPMPDGHYLTSLSDVTELHLAADTLRRSNEQLEKRVELRTLELTQTNIALAEAKRVAEKANESQAKFLAAASHDLLQPLQAARLFMGALHEDLPVAQLAQHDLLRNADISIESANRLLRALLNLSRLEMGGVRPEVRPVDVAALLEALKREFDQIAHDKGLRLHIMTRQTWVMSDPDLLRSVLQNLIQNAVRYTKSGTVFVCCRNDPAGIRLEVRDSGPGIPQKALGRIFKEFSRLENNEEEGSGAGLGLAIVERVCNLLGHQLRVQSRLGAGSTFMVIAPLASPDVRFEIALPQRGQLVGLRVLYVENEALTLKSMEALLGRWGVEIIGVPTAAEALALKDSWDVVLADYQLDGDITGLELIEAMAGRAHVFALVTANWNEDMIERAAALGVEIIRKPVAPASLRAFLTRARRMNAAAE